MKKLGNKKKGKDKKIKVERKTIKIRHVRIN